MSLTNTAKKTPFVLQEPTPIKFNGYKVIVLVGEEVRGASVVRTGDPRARGVERWRWGGRIWAVHAECLIQRLCTCSIMIVRWRSDVC